MEKLEYSPKGELLKVAEEVICLLTQKQLPVWQVKEVLSEAAKLAEWQVLR